MAKKTKGGLYCIQFYVNESEYNQYTKIYEKFRKLRINRSAGKSEISESAFCRRIILNVDPLHRGAPIGNKNRAGKKGKNDEIVASILLKTDRTSTDKKQKHKDKVVETEEIKKPKNKVKTNSQKSETPIRDMLDELLE